MVKTVEKMAESNKDGGFTPVVGERPKKPWKGGEVVKSIMNAGPDAIVTSFSLISSISASHHSSGTYFSSQFSISWLLVIMKELLRPFIYGSRIYEYYCIKKRNELFSKNLVCGIVVLNLD